MNRYFASRIKHKELWCQLSDQLNDQWHHVVSSWIRQWSLKPYHEHLEQCAQIASQALQEIQKADIFVLMSDEGGTDMFVELGIALASPWLQQIYIVGEHNQRSLMHFHPNIQRVSSLQEIFKLQNITINIS
jgi:hypothetical protein